MDYYLSRFPDLGFEAACERVRETVQAHGFGIPLEIDLAGMLHEKLGANLRAYRIIGTCLPQLALAAVLAEPQIGILMPCNWIVREDAEGRVEVSVMDPAVLVEATGNATLLLVAEDARQRILAALDEV